MKPVKQTLPLKGSLAAMTLLLNCWAATLTAETITSETITSDKIGEFDGFAYSFWRTDGDASITLHDGGRYEALWTSDTQEWIGGVGWNPGGPRIVNYSGTFMPDSDSNAHLSLNGWTKDPYVEYFIIDTYGVWKPTNGSDYKGSFESDGAEYEVYSKKLPVMGIDGKQVYEYYSIRKEKKLHGPISGTITTANHFDAWANMGLPLGEHDYMIMATWSYLGGGSSEITVSSTESSQEPEIVNSNSGSTDLWLLLLIAATRLVWPSRVPTRN